MSAQSSQALQAALHPGTTPLLISVPHAGTGLIPGMYDRFTSAAKPLPDTDWFVAKLYEFARSLGASMLVANVSRLVVDLNRPPDDKPLYNEAQTRLMTGVVPSQCFSGEPVYLSGQEPKEHEVSSRLEAYWKPYHATLRNELDVIHSRHGHAIVLDAHSIRSEVPLLFDGVLADLNLGSNGGASAAGDLLRLAVRRLEGGSYSTVIDGRFRGGYITRHYGQPAEGVHALQLEISQRAYMQEEPPAWMENRASTLQSHLQKLLESLIQWKP